MASIMGNALEQAQLFLKDLQKSPSLALSTKIPDKIGGLLNHMGTVINKLSPVKNVNNNTGNNQTQWLGKITQNSAYPVLQNPYAEPISEPPVGNVRAANYQIGNPFSLLSSILGQTDAQMAIQRPKTFLNLEGQAKPQSSQKLRLKQPSDTYNNVQLAPIKVNNFIGKSQVYRDVFTNLLNAGEIR